MPRRRLWLSARSFFPVISLNSPSTSWSTFSAVLLAIATLLPTAHAQEKIVIQYDCIPNYANWGGVTAQYQKETGVRVPPDMKGSSATMAALETEKANPQADVAYYNAAIGFQAAGKGLHQPYKQQGFEKIPAGLRDPDGLWWAVHSAHIAIIVNVPALKGKAVPRSFADLLKPEYKGLIAYDDPTIHGTSFTFIYGINNLVGGGADFNKGFDYLKKLDANVSNYPRENSYNDVLRGEIPIWINADGNGLKMKWTDKAKVEIVIPEEGTVVAPLVMALVKGAPHVEEAKKYLDWCLGESAQKTMAESFFQPIMSVNLGDLSAKFPPASAYAKAVAPPLGEMAANADAVKARWVKEIKGSR